MENVFSALANRVTKTSKRSAWEAWLELADNDKFMQGLDYHQKQAFIDIGSYFIPTISKAKNTPDALQWVAKACGVKDLRKYLNHVHVDASKMVASDGHRLHIVYKAREDLEYPEGFICRITGKGIGEQGTFPDVGRIIPSNLFWHKLDGVTVQHGVPKNRYGVPTIDSKKRVVRLSAFIGDLSLASSYGVSLYLNERYYNDAISGLGNSYEVALCGTEGKVLFRNESRLALVMSMKVDDESVYLD